MNTIKFGVAVMLASALISCENPIRTETKVHEDGSLDKIIELDKVDSFLVNQNIFNINESKGWKVDVSRSDRDSTSSKDEFKIRFEKSFASAEEANKDLANESDTLFQITSKFTKSFRWFYTYIRYSEVYRPIDRLKKVKAIDYFNAEDKSFIDRLPGEGISMSKADSFFLQNLNQNIFETYAREGMFLEQFDILTQVIQKNLPDKKWLDTLNRQADFIFERLEDWEGDPLFAAKIADTLGIPLPKESAKDFEVLSNDLNRRIAFMSFARDGKYVNVVEMPWSVIKSNADSVGGNKLYWRPLVTKFTVQEYEMFAESRKLNWWAVGISVLILVVTIFLFLKKQSGIGYR